MKSILETCTPRQSILKGTFNPEVFTASLGPVIQYYKGKNSAIDAIYTDADAFFTEATYPTHGLVQTVGNVFKRISGDASVPTIQRLETAFGGGKTHTLIACVHIAYRGTEIAEAAKNVIDSAYLPLPGSVTVVGIAGDEIPVNKTHGDTLIPYTLWGELAYQVGGKGLYDLVKTDAESYAAPGRPFLDAVLKGKKVLIMLDELAQYAARLEVAVSDGASQLAAFLMSLIEYSKATTGIAIVVTLASSADAFSRQTESLTKLLNRAGNGDLKADDAVSIAEGAAASLTSVIRRNESTVTPVDANEISAVLAKRLFTQIDSAAASETAEEYAAMYARNRSSLPDDATRPDYAGRMAAMYPFHPTFVSFLNDKLSQAENFQGTRGVLRTLALTVRSIWEKKMNIGMIHVSDINLQNAQLVDEILGRTKSADLRTVLTADIGSVESIGLQSGMSNAQRADRRNPHPDGILMYEKTWRTVFLNSLVGRAAGKASNIFGISQKEAVFQISTPLFAPSQVKTALDEISESAFYLRYEDGKYFAHLDPTINSVLAMIRTTIDDRQIKQKLKSAANGLASDNYLFHIEHDVRYPQDIPDNLEKPIVAMVALDADPVNIKEMCTTCGDGRARIRQNLVLLLVPKTVEVEGFAEEQMSLFSASSKSDEARGRLENIARQVLAIKALEENPQSYGISPAKLRDAEFSSRKDERNLALTTTVNEMYTSFYFSGPGGFVKKEIRTAAGESGASILNQIESVLTEAGELVRPSNGDRYGASMLQSLANEYFFRQSDKNTCRRILDNFYNLRTWPLLPGKDSLEKLLREGVESGIWAAYKMSHDITDAIPGEFYSQKKPLPINVSLVTGDYSLMTAEGAKKRGWTESDRVPNEKVKNTIRDILQSSGAVTAGEIRRTVQSAFANADKEQIDDNIREMMQDSICAAYTGEVTQTAKPEEIVAGFVSYNHDLAEDEVIISRSEMAERGWNGSSSRSFCLSGNDGAKKVFSVLRRIGSLYTRSGAKSTIDTLDMTDLRLAGGASMRISLENAKPDDIKRLDEFFQAFCDAVKVTNETEVDFVINNPDPNCALVKELKK